MSLVAKSLRLTKNPKLVQKALNHAKNTTTMRYAHVLDDDVADGIERLAQSRTKSLHKLSIPS